MGGDRLRYGQFILIPFAFIFGLSVLGAGRTVAQSITFQIISASGDGAGHRLEQPFGIAVDFAGNVYVTGYGTDNAFKITPDGVISQIIDASGDGAGNTLDRPRSIAVDLEGNVYVAGSGSDNAFKITLVGTITEIIDGSGDGVGNVLRSPEGIAVDTAGNIFVSGYSSFNAFKIAIDGVITEIIDGSGDGMGVLLRHPQGIAADAEGNVFVTGSTSDNVFKVTPAGVISQIIDASGDGAGHEFGSPQQIALDAFGNTYITSGSFDNVFKITPGGTITEIINLAGQGSPDVLSSPYAIAIDGMGSGYVTGAVTDNAFKFAPDCNNNGIDDGVDIANCSTGDPACADCNANGVLDACDTLVVFDAITISNSADGASSVFAADLDGDGDTDVLSASLFDYKIAWYENTDGVGTLGPEKVISVLAEGASDVFAADLDGDADVDVLSASSYDNKVAWYANIDGSGIFGPQQVISTAAEDAVSVFAADLDGDGDIDVLSASVLFDKIAWYKNTDGAGAFGPQQVISTATNSPVSVFAADVDGDGDVDVLSASYNDGKIAWFENSDGLGMFGPQQVVSTAASGARCVFGADVDGDGDIDLLSASSGDDKIAWYENTDGGGTFGPQRVISIEADKAQSVFAADIDGDGDPDALSASEGDNKISWYENTDGAGAFGPQQVISVAPFRPLCVFAADLDGDGDPDALSASYIDDEIAWYKNTDHDCNENQVPDECELARHDCNGNGIVDLCELDGRDCNGNSILDSCENTPPVCDAGRIYSVECQGQTTTIQLDGSGSFDADPGDSLTFAWSTDCTGAAFDDASLAMPTLTISTSGCSTECGVSLTVTDSFDGCGGSASCMQLIAVADKAVPVFGPEAMDLIVECDSNGNVEDLNDWLDSHGGAVATDSCGEVTWSHDFAGLSDGCGAGGDAVVTFAATDACGNTAKTEAMFAIQDHKPPTLVCPADVGVGCRDSVGPAETGRAIASDACSADAEIVIDYADTVARAECPADPASYTITRTWRGMDACGLGSQCEQLIKVAKMVVPLDARPAVCPNIYQADTVGVLTVAILGTEDFGVAGIDASSFRISRGNCLFGSVAPIGNDARIADVGTPFDGAACACRALGGDGIDDLVMEFDLAELDDALRLSSADPSRPVPIVVTGRVAGPSLSFGGCEVLGRDCLRIVRRGSGHTNDEQPGQLNLPSNLDDGRKTQAGQQDSDGTIAFPVSDACGSGASVAPTTGLFSFLSITLIWRRRRSGGR